MLSQAEKNLGNSHPKLKLIIFDALRPRSVRFLLWEKVKGTDQEQYAAQPQEEWDADEEELSRIQTIWDKDFGDRQHEIVLIGQRMNPKEITRLFDDCLLTDSELKKGKEYWSKAVDPFPSWDSPST